MTRFILFGLAALYLAACASVSESDIRAAYKTEAGPYAVTDVHRTSMRIDELDKDLQMRVAFPKQAGSYPLIVLSHGNGCYQDLYTSFADHWASWGYVVVQPVHMDSRETGFSMKGVNMTIMNEVITSRRADVRFILDSLDQLESQVPGLTGKIDRDRLVMAGHSMGGGTAMALTGVTMVNPRDGSVISSDEDRFDALLLITEPSNNRLMPNEPWQMAKVPTFIATGSEDYSLAGGRGGKKSKSAYQLQEGAELPDQPHYYLYIDAMDHFLGGLMCREAPGPEDHDAQKIINGASTAFLDAVTADDAAAAVFITSNEIAGLTGERATLELR